MPVAKERGMKRVLMFLVVMLLCSAPAFAFNQTRPQFVFTPPQQSRVQTTLGMTRIHTKAANIRIAWLPFLAPLPYSYPRTTQEIPNPLVMTGTEIPQRPHARIRAVIAIPR